MVCSATFVLLLLSICLLGSAELSPCAKRGLHCVDPESSSEPCHTGVLPQHDLCPQARQRCCRDYGDADFWRFVQSYVAEKKQRAAETGQTEAPADEAAVKMAVQILDETTQDAGASPLSETQGPRVSSAEEEGEGGIGGEMTGALLSHGVSRLPVSDTAKELGQNFVERLHNGDGVVQASAETAADYVVERAKLSASGTGMAINRINELAHDLGASKEVTGTTQAVADAIPSNFVPNAFRAGTRVIAHSVTGDTEKLKEEVDDWAEGRRGAPLQGYGQVSRFLASLASGKSRRHAADAAVDGSQDTLAYQLGTALSNSLPLAYNVKTSERGLEYLSPEQRYKRQRMRDESIRMMVTKLQQRGKIQSLPEVLLAPVIGYCREVKYLRRCLIQRVTLVRKDTLPHWKLDRSYRPYHRDILAIAKMAREVAAEHGLDKPSFDEQNSIFEACAGALHKEWRNICVKDKVLGRTPNPENYDASRWTWEEIYKLVKDGMTSPNRLKE